tara:strand:+ start:423 stop:1088 length:666 start_codon:yes stop_codon:yes gene_type:complete
MSTITTLTEDEVNNQGMLEFNKPDIPMPSSMPGFDLKTIVIIILVILLAFSLIGINLINFMSGIVDYIGDILRPLIGSFLSAFTYITGVTINTTTDVIADTAKTGIDIAEDTLQSVGNILIDASKRDVVTEVSEKIERSSGDEPKNEPEPDSGETSIQNPITAKKTNWCLVGDQNQRRSCASVKDADKCMSGDIFPTQESCLNPNLITNVLPDKQRVTLVN